MADLLSQKEIDNLLNSTISAAETSDSVSEVAEEKVKSRPKTFAHNKVRSVRFTYSYQSPVIKKENLIFNPEPDKVEIGNKVIVRTLDNYIKYLTNKKGL
jgi:hypothetical protein